MKYDNESSEWAIIVIVGVIVVDDGGGGGILESLKSFFIQIFRSFREQTHQNQKSFSFCSILLHQWQTSEEQNTCTNWISHELVSSCCCRCLLMIWIFECMILWVYILFMRTHVRVRFRPNRNIIRCVTVVLLQLLWLFHYSLFHHLISRAHINYLLRINMSAGQRTNEQRMSEIERERDKVDNWTGTKVPYTHIIHYVMCAFFAVSFLFANGSKEKK